MDSYCDEEATQKATHISFLSGEENGSGGVLL